MTESSQLINQETALVPHLVPPESMLPHLPQSFNAMLPQHQHYDTYMQPDSLNTQESASPLLRESANILIDPAIALPEDSSPQGSPPTSAGNKQIAANLTQTEPIAGAQVAIPKWLTDTITQLKHELKLQRQKLEAGDIIHKQAEELNQLEDEVDKSCIKTLQSSTESLKSKAAQAISDNSKDNIWSSGVCKCFLKAIGITKPSVIREYHPHVNGLQIDGDQTTAAQISSHCQPEGQKERLTQGWHKGKHENECIRDKSNLKTPEWDFAFTLPYQSSDESMQSGDDDCGGIDPDTEEDKDIWLKLCQFNQAVDHLNMVALEMKKSSRRHTQVIGEPRDRDLPDIKMSPKILIELIDWEWLHAHPQDPTRYNGTINDDQVTVPIPEQDANHWHAETEDNFEAELADDEGELGFDEE
ncbi:hypothetical protein EDB19DRAFT_1828358 [Suillus lakei]|nr:hypothetical protein EDB19DRAFT_1828358 [Suillus lakei]